MRNWNYIDGAKSVRIGNGWSGSFTDVYPGSDVSNEIYKELQKNNFDKAKTIDALSNKYKRIPNSKQYFEDMVEQVMKSYSKRILNDTPAEYAKRPAKIVGGNSLPEELEKDVHKKDKEKVEDIEELKKTGNANFETLVEKGKLGLWNWYVHKDGTIVAGGTSATESEARSAAEKALKREKVGNSLVWTSTSNEPRKMPFTETSLKYAYENAKKKGLSGSKLEAEMLRIAKTTPHSSSATEQEMKKDVSEWILANGKPEDFVQNKCTVNSKTFYIIAPNGEKVEAIDYDQWHYKCLDTGELVEKRFSKLVGNSASDDKFAYVMREFDEGKLKTPDGKVVTDPAQAKAIAYSESKKTENGLARARNAIKK